MDDIPTNPALAVASVLDVLPLHQASLIGVMTGNDSTAALFRLKNGQIQRAVIGDTVDRAVLLAIDEAGVMLARAGETSRLTLPGA